jgi:hypothetical protein
MVPQESTVIPYGELKLTEDPMPSEKESLPYVPARVDTSPADVIWRIVYRSTTYKVPEESTVSSRSFLKLAEVPNPSAFPNKGPPANVETKPAAFIFVGKEKQTEEKQQLEWREKEESRMVTIHRHRHRASTRLSRTSAT